MGLRDCYFESVYEKCDDVLHNFYIPALSNCNTYKRVSAYFSSDVLKLYSKGLSSFVKSDGKIRFIFSEHLSPEDFELIKQGYQNKINETLLNDISNLQDCPSISNLAYLISKGVVEIKIGFMKPGTLHFKFGLISDGDDVLFFRGSTNETPAGILLNGENFETTKSWNCGKEEKEKIDKFNNIFEDLWNNRREDVVVVDAPECVVSTIEKHNKNTILLDYVDECSNSFVLDFDDGNKLIGVSFLENKTLISANTLFYKTKIQYCLDYQDSFGTFHFMDMKPNDLKLLINDFDNFSKEKGFSLFVSERVKNFLNALDLQIEKRRSLGLAIKKHDTSNKDVLNEFNKFITVVDNELSRPLKMPQMWDAFHAVELIGAANFSVPGTGKTAIAYGAFAYLSSQQAGRKVKRIIMIGPKNSFMSWKNEFGLCFGNKRELNCINIQDKKYKNANQISADLYQLYDRANLILINYEALQNFTIFNAMQDLMRKHNYSDYLIMDEAHKIKGIGGRRATAVMKLANLAKYKLVLTGTPIPNSYQDIYNILNILYTGEYDTFFGYSPAYLSQVSHYPSKMENINKQIYPFFCRTTKKDLNIPAATHDYETGKIIMDEREKALFEIVHDSFDSNFLVLYIRLLQASINPSKLLNKLTLSDLSFFGGEDIDDLDFFKDVEKLFKVADKVNAPTISEEDKKFIENFGFTRKFYKGIDIIQNLCSKGESVVAWGVFVDTLFSIQHELAKRNIPSVVISGSMPLEERETNIQRFLNGEYKVLISNPHTLAESVSLHHVCHNAVYFEYTFNLTHLLQSRDRIHRLGLPQETVTTYYYLSIDNGDYYKNSIDIKTLNRLALKEQNMINAVENDELFIKTTSYDEDIKFILGK